MTVKPYDIRTFGDLLSDLRDEQLVVPNFQRDFEWERAKQHRFAASVLCGLPIGGMVMFSGHGRDFAHRTLCSAKPIESRREEVTFLLDGQQRLATLRSLFDDPFADQPVWDEAWALLHPPLQTRWYLCLSRAGHPCFGARSGNGEPALSYTQATELPLEPADILESIVPRRVTKRAAEHNPPWWHPAFATGTNREQMVAARREIAKRAAQEEVIPLWEIASTEHLKARQLVPLHVLAIREIALNLEKELRSRVHDDPQDETVLAVARQADLASEGEIRPIDDVVQLLTTTSSTWATLVVQTVQQLMELQIPTITVKGQLRRAVTIFENINEGGTRLTVFDLVNAKAVPGFYDAPSLRNRVRSALGDTSSASTPAGITSLLPIQYADEIPRTLVTGVKPTKTPANIRNQYLNLLSIFGHGQHLRSLDEDLRVEYIKRDKQLALTATQINDCTELACQSLFRACLFLQSRVGRIKPENCNYALMLLPLAIVLSDDELFGTTRVWHKLEYWYWVSLLGGRYRERQNEIAVRDVRALYHWCADEAENPFAKFERRVLSEPGYSDRDVFLSEDDTQQVPEAVADALLDFTLSRNPRDFLPEDWKSVTLTTVGTRRGEWVMTTDGNSETQKYRMELVAHHIVALGSVTKIDDSAARLRGMKESLYNSPLNKTRISKFANEKLGGRSPAAYFEEMPTGVLRRHQVGLTGGEIAARIEGDEPFANPPKEAGIRSVLADRFAMIKAEIEGRLDWLKGRVGE